MGGRSLCPGLQSTVESSPGAFRLWARSDTPVSIVLKEQSPYLKPEIRQGDAVEENLAKKIKSNLGLSGVSDPIVRIEPEFSVKRAASHFVGFAKELDADLVLLTTHAKPWKADRRI